MQTADLPAGDVRSNIPWLWRRLHEASADEALALAAGRPGVDPTDPDAGQILARYRADRRRS